MALNLDDLAASLKQQIESFEAPVETVDTGRIIEVGDGIARVYGLGKVKAGEMVEFKAGVKGMALNLESDNVGIVVFEGRRYLAKIRFGNSACMSDSVFDPRFRECINSILLRFLSND